MNSAPAGEPVPTAEPCVLPGDHGRPHHHRWCGTGVDQERLRADGERGLREVDRVFAHLVGHQDLGRVLHHDTELDRGVRGDADERSSGDVGEQHGAVRDDLVIRLRRPLKPEDVQRLEAEFSVLIKQGRMMQRGPLEGETDHLSLSRIVFHHTRHKFGMIRKLIDRINDCEPA